MATEKQEMQKELELQLHEQYAINNNANVNSFIAMITALLIAFTGYGYVLYQYLMGDVCCGKMADAETMVHIATFAVLVVIFILYMVAVQIGASQRSDQFVIHNIRKKAYNSSQYDTIFPQGYTPFRKGFCTFVQGIYNTLSWIFLVIYTIIAVTSICKIDVYWWLVVLYSAGLVSMLGWRICKFHKYKQVKE